MSTDAHQAVIRFGLGRRGAETLPTDPRAWLRAQLAAPDPIALDPALASSGDALRAEADKRRNKGDPDADLPMRAIVAADAHAQTGLLLTSPSPFRERLVAFWANHFTVSARNGEVRALAGPYVREAIRPHVMGSFPDMALAVMRHPAMLIYLNNNASIGPDSPAGLRSHKGLNENLARECLELHTVSPAGGYTQGDVTAFAHILTGWSVQHDGHDAGFAFRPNAHQPGPKTLLRQTFVEGERGGLDALAYLGTHPATARHLADKLCRHFLADDPPAAAVQAVARSLVDHDFALRPAYETLIRQPAAWVPLAKLRNAADYAVAVLRALDLPEARRPPLPPVMARLGQPLWGAPAPNGFGDRATEWSGPDAMLRRVDFAYQVAGAAPDLPPEDLADAALGPFARPATLDAIRTAGSRREALAMLLSCPEFQRR